MLTITLDGKDADITLEGEKSVGDVLAGIESWLEGGGLFISGVEIDGKKAGTSSLDEAFGCGLEDISRLDILTSSEEDLCTEARLTLFALENAVNDIAARLENFSLDMQMGKDAQAAETVRLFTFLFEDLTRILRRLFPDCVLCGAPEAEPEAPSAEGGGASPLEADTVEELFAYLSAVLREFVAAYEAEDSILAGDLAEYEVAPCLKKLYIVTKQKVEETESVPKRG